MSPASCGLLEDSSASNCYFNFAMERLSFWVQILRLNLETIFPACLGCRCCGDLALWNRPSQAGESPKAISTIKNQGDTSSPAS